MFGFVYVFACYPRTPFSLHNSYTFPISETRIAEYVPVRPTCKVMAGLMTCSTVYESPLRTEETALASKGYDNQESEADEGKRG